MKFKKTSIKHTTLFFAPIKKTKPLQHEYQKVSLIKIITIQLVIRINSIKFLYQSIYFLMFVLSKCFFYKYVAFQQNHTFNRTKNAFHR